MSAHQIIEKHGHKVKVNTLVFFLWLCSRHPEGVLRKTVPSAYKNLSISAISKYMHELYEEGLIRYENEKSGYSKVIPCP